MGPQPVDVQPVFAGGGVHPHAAVAGLLAQILRLFAVIQLGPVQLAAQGMDQVAAVDAQHIIILIAFIVEQQAAVRGQKGPCQGFPEELALDGQAGGNGHRSQLFPVLPYGQGLGILVHHDAVMAVGNHVFELVRGHIALHIVAILLPPGAHAGKALHVGLQHQHGVALSMQGTQHAAGGAGTGVDILMLQFADVHHRHRGHEAGPGIGLVGRQEQRRIADAHRRDLRRGILDLQGDDHGLLGAVFYGEGQGIAPRGHIAALQLAVPAEDVGQAVAGFQGPGFEMGFGRVSLRQLHVDQPAARQQVVDQEAVVTGVDHLPGGDAVLQGRQGRGDAHHGLRMIGALRCDQVRAQ